MARRHVDVCDMGGTDGCRKLADAKCGICARDACLVHLSSTLSMGTTVISRHPGAIGEELAAAKREPGKAYSYPPPVAPADPPSMTGLCGLQVGICVECWSMVSMNAPADLKPFLEPPTKQYYDHMLQNLKAYWAQKGLTR